MTKKQLKQFVAQAKIDVSYKEAEKEWFLRLARCVLREIAKRLGLQKDQFDLRTNKAGIAVSGEVTLHTDKIYIQFGQSCVFPPSFMYRSCKDRKDYTGGMNNWMEWDQLLDFDKAIKRFKKVIPD